jgi:hypothetical protein
VIKTCFILLFTLTPGFANAMPNLITSDTLVILGTCSYIGQTQNIIATTYFRFNVIEVKQGSYQGDFIIIEGDVNNKGYTLLQQGKTKPVRINPDEIFPGISTELKVFQCSAPSVTFRVLPFSDENSGAISYRYIGE